MGKSSGGQREIGLLFIRIGLGVIFVLYGQPILFGGVEHWESVGKAMSHVKIDFLPALWGFLAGFAAFVGGICLMLGFAFRPALLLMLVTMVVATVMNFNLNAGFEKITYPLAMAIIFLSLFFTGPGRYSVSRF